MPLDARELDRRVKKLRKSLKGFPKDPTADEVHDLRTRTRRVESILQSLEMDSYGNARKLLQGLQAVRKRAGKVRDLDVFTSYIVGLGVKEETPCVVRLLHHLGAKRQRQANKLHSVVQNEASDLRQRLKRSRRRLHSTVDRFSRTKFELDSKRNGQGEEAPLHAMSVALRLSKELAAAQRLGVNNLHPYRLEVKRLRYVLEMADGDGGREKAFIQQLKQVQDVIGEWHDWVELSAIAHKVLGPHPGCKLVGKIEETRNKTLKESLRVTEQMRRHYLPSARHAKRSRANRPRPSVLSGPVLVATSEIAA